MTGNTQLRRVHPGWYYLLPEVAAPLGGGLIKLGHASTWAAVSVGLAPYVLLAALYGVFLIGYTPAVIYYLCSKNKQEAAEQLITTTTNAIVALLTLTPPPNCSRRTRRSGTQPAQPRSKEAS